jgi:hypothetical protein
MPNFLCINSHVQGTGKGKDAKAKAPVATRKIEYQDEGISIIIVLTFYNA